MSNINSQAGREATRHRATTGQPVAWRAVRHLGIGCLALSLTGCGAALKKWTDNNSFLVAAEPLCEDTPGSEIAADGTCKPGGFPAPAPSPADIQQYLGLVINESEHNCGEFVSGLVLASNTTNTGLDGLTTLFTGLGSVFTPLATVHALTAAGAVASGWKTAIDSDVYAKATIANYAQAIQSGYWTDLQTYMTALDNSTPAQIAQLVKSWEVAKIRSIHKECSLATAQTSISTTMRSDDTSTPGASTSSAQSAAGAATQPGAGGASQKTASGAAAATTAATGTASAGAPTRMVVPGHPIR